MVYLDHNKVYWMLYLLVSAVVLFVSTSLFKRAAGSLSLLKPNMLNYIYWWQILVMSFVAAVLVVNKLDFHYVIYRVSDEARIGGWMSVMYMMTTFPVGLLMAKRFWLGKVKTSVALDDYVGGKINISGSNGGPLKYSIFVFTVISIAACIYTFYVIRYFPFIKLLTTSSSELGVVRINSSRFFSGNVYVKNILALMLMPLLAYVWCFYFIATRRLTDRLVFIVSFLFAISILYYNFAKGPLLWYLVSYIFVWFYAKGRVEFSRVFVLAGLAFILLVLMYSMIDVGISEFAGYNSGPLGRVLIGQAAGTYYMFDIFPDKYGFIGFSSLSELLSGFFGFEHSERAARIAMMDFNPRGIDAGTAGVMNSLFVAEAWANFGVVGVVLSPLWVGFVIGSLYYFFLKSDKNPLMLALFVTFSYGGSFTGGFNDYIYNGGYLTLVFLVLSIIGVSSVFKSFAVVRVSNEKNHFPPPPPA